MRLGQTSVTGECHPHRRRWPGSRSSWPPRAESLRDITVGDCLELLEISAVQCDQHGRAARAPTSTSSCTPWAIFPADAPPTVRMFSTMYQGQLTPDELIDRYDLACRPVRDLLVDYLSERQPGLDYTTLTGLATHLGLLFWKDLENHHPGIDSLHLPPDIAAAWKQRIQTKDGPRGPVKTGCPASDVASCLNTVRAFYLDIAQWAAEDPARWGKWAVRCPIRARTMQSRKERSHRKSRMDQRTRERLPAVPALAASVSQRTQGRRRASCKPPRAPARRGVHRGRADAAPCRADAIRPSGSGPRTPAPACAATSPAKKTTRSGPGRPWRSCAAPASASRS